MSPAFKSTVFFYSQIWTWNPDWQYFQNSWKTAESCAISSSFIYYRLFAGVSALSNPVLVKQVRNGWLTIHIFLYAHACWQLTNIWCKSLFFYGFSVPIVFLRFYYSGSWNEPLALLGMAGQNPKHTTFTTYVQKLEQMIADMLDYRYNKAKHNMSQSL